MEQTSGKAATAILFALVLLFCLAAYPTLAYFGFIEITFAVLLATFSATGFVFGWKEQRQLDLPGWIIVGALGIFLTTFLMSAGTGLLRLMSAADAARASLPYIGILGGLAIWSFSSRLDQRNIVLALSLVGVTQVGYLIWLYLTNTGDILSTYEISISRITILDPRTTEPFFLSVSLLPLSLLLMERTKAHTKALAVTLSVIGFWGAILILSRSVALAIVSGYLVFTIIWLLMLPSVRRDRLNRTLWTISVPILVMATTLLPPIKALSETVLLRTSLEAPLTEMPQLMPPRVEHPLKPQLNDTVQPDLDDTAQPDLDDTAQPELEDAVIQEFVSRLPASFRISLDESSGVERLTILQVFALSHNHVQPSVASDVLQQVLMEKGIEVDASTLTTLLLRRAWYVSNTPPSLGSGRVENEWLPAITSYRDGGWSVWLFGFGAGHKLETKTGDTQRYIHNYILHILLFNGAIGILGFTVFYGALAGVLLIRIKQSSNPIYSATFALLTSLQVYALFFAVHKLLSFNLMIIAITLVAIYPISERTIGLARLWRGLWPGNSLATHNT